jgi:hypothetical protein
MAKLSVTVKRPKLTKDLHKLGQELAAIFDELFDLRAAEQSELRKLERGLAYDAACSTIDSNCEPAGVEHGDWFDIDDVAEFSGDFVGEAVKYLELRGLIARHPDHPNWVSMLDESEAL